MDIDQAFRLAPVAWRLQVLVTDAFMSELMREATLPSGAACDSQALLDRARLARHSGALSPERLRGIKQPLTLNDIHCWVTDAREITRLKVSDRAVESMHSLSNVRRRLSIAATNSA